MSTTITTLVRHLRSLAVKQAMGDWSDQQLLEAFLKQRSEASFAALVRRHGAMVLSVCLRVLHNSHDAEDAFQATFLLFARKAASIRKHESLGSWLHGVAFHTAEKLKRTAARQTARERNQARDRADDPMEKITWRELRSVLDEELAKLPEQYRAPLVLCYLEGKTRDEAARQLGWTKAVFRRRLEQGRARLGVLLRHRGLTLSAVLSGPLLTEAIAPAMVPPLLADRTVRAGLALAMGQTPTELVPAQVALLTRGALSALFAGKLKPISALVLVMGLTVGGLLVHQGSAARTAIPQAAQTPPAAPKAPPRPATPADGAAQTVAVRGRVLGPDGKPIVGAKVYVSTYTEKNKTDPKVQVETDEKGRFRFASGRAEADKNEMIAAVAPGYGPDWASIDQAEAGRELILHLVKDDVPIQGRVLDLENRPIAGTTVRLVRVRKMPREDLEPWIKDMRTEGSKSIFDLGRSRILLTYERIMKPVWGVLGVPHVVKTDAAGRFRLSGLGRERVVELAVEGSGVEHRQITVLTRGDLPKGLPPFTYGARFDFRASPAKPIVGTVREKSSGKPLAGIEVACVFVSGTGSRTDLTPAGGAKAITDAQGHYRLPGTPKAKQYHLGAAGGRYFAATKVVDDSPDLGPITADFELERGILIRGRLTDKVTGKPVLGNIFYLPRADNPSLKDYPEFARVSTSATAAEKDGSYTLPALPGRGLICARARDDRFLQAELGEENGKPPVLLQLATFHSIAAIDVSEKDPKSQVHDIVLEPGRTLRGRVFGLDGKPLPGAFVAGLTAAPSVLYGSPPKPKLTEDDFTAVALDPLRPRLLVFWHEQRKLAKAVPVRGEEPAPLIVRLEPLGAVTGLLVDTDGQPRAGVLIEARYSSRQAKILPGELGKVIPGIGTAALPLPRATSGPDGRFRIEGLVSGLKYDLVVSSSKQESSLTEDLAVAGGQCKELGKMRADRKTEK